MQNPSAHPEVGNVPEHLLDPPESLVNSPPVTTRVQNLPFDQLSWQNFEKLIFRLASKNCEVEHCATYGRAGQSQDGIDVYTRLSGGGYICWQAKNRANTTESVITDAVHNFLNGRWVDSTKRFILCSSASLQDTKLQNTIEKFADCLKQKGIVFEALDGNQLSEKLRNYHEIIDDFFGREWLVAFAGENAATNLSRPLDTARMLALRECLAKFYDARIHQLDPGLILTPGKSVSCDLRKRFVLPNVDAVNPFHEPSLEPKDWAQVPVIQNNHASKFDEYSELAELSDFGKLQSEPMKTPTVAFEDWLLECNRSLLILGAPGSGKSTVLRCLALDLVCTPELFPRVTEKLGERIPLLIPFALWSRLTTKQKREVGLPEVIRETFGAFIPQSELEDSFIDALLCDERFLLLIDGLDEYSDEQAALTTLATIETFVRTRNVATIMTTRPTGLRRLELTSGYWKTALLTELLPHQQRDLATKLLNAQDGISVPVSLRVERFFEELQCNGRLQSLAGNPLLLFGLLSVAEHQITLPKTRIELFQTLIEIMLNVHPSRRATAASEVKSRLNTFSTDDVRREALGKLAFEMQTRGAGVSINRKDAQLIIKNFLEDSDDGPGWSIVEARAGADELVNLDADTSGLLIENGTNELTFCHAAFREHLAGLELAAWPLEKQLKFVADHSDEPRWRGTIVTLVQSLGQKDDVEKILQVMQEKEHNGDVGSINRRLLLADCVFTAESLSGIVAQSVALDSFSRIEKGTNDTERLELLGLALDSPRGGFIGKEIVNRLERWWPEVNHWRKSLYEELSNWPASDDLARTLQLALQGDESQLAAAACIAKVFGGNLEVGNELTALARTSSNPCVVAASLDALNRGWPLIDGLEDWLWEAEQSPNIQLRTVAALALHQRGRRGDSGRDSLLRALGANWNMFSNDIYEEIIEALVAEWGGDSELQNECWAAIGKQGPSIYNVRSEDGRAILLRLYKEDHRVLRWIEEELVNNDHFLFSAMRSEISLLEPLLAEHSNLQKAFDTFLSRNESSIFNHKVAQLAATVKSNIAKRAMMNWLDEAGSFVFWPVWSLVHGWGIDDPEVASILKPLAQISPKRRQHIASHIPAIVESVDESLELLIEICNLSEVGRLDYVIQGFSALGENIDDARAVSAILPHIGKVERVFAGHNVLIGRFHADARVREFALRRVHEPFPPLDQMASVYGNDSEIASLILKRAASLPKVLRQFIARRATQRFNDEALAQVLHQSEIETDEHAMTQATIGLSYVALATPGAANERTGKLRKQLHAIGPDYDDRRVAALGGLLALGRIDVFGDAKEHHSGDALRIDLVAHFKDYAPVLELVAERWKELESTLGESLAGRLDRWGDGRSNFWQSFAPYLNRSPRLRSRFIEYCNDSSVMPDAHALKTLSQLRPRSSLLLDCCRRILTGEFNHQQAGFLDITHSVIAASKYLATMFSEETSAISAIVEACESLKAEGGALFGLAVKWPNHEIVVREHQNLLRGDGCQLLTCVKLWLVCAQGNPEQVANAFARFVTRQTGSPWDFPQEALDAFRARLERDFTVAEAIGQLAKNHDHASIRASTIRLLAMTSSHDVQELRKEFLAAEFQRPGLPRFALDILTNRVLPAKELMSMMLTESGD